MPSVHLLPAYVLRVWALQRGLSPKAKALSPSPLPTGGHCHTVLLTKSKAELRDGGSPELCFSALYDVTEKQLSCCVSVPPRVKQSRLLSSSSSALCDEVFGITADIFLCKTFTIPLLSDFFFFNLPVFGKHR